MYGFTTFNFRDQFPCVSDKVRSLFTVVEEWSGIAREAGEGTITLSLDGATAAVAANVSLPKLTYVAHLQNHKGGPGYCYPPSGVCS